MISYSHSTGFPSRRVYKVLSSNKDAQEEAFAFMKMFSGYVIGNTKGKIKYILV